MSLTEKLKAQVALNLDAIFAPDPPKHIGIAVSGGGDSMALLHLAQDWANAQNVTLCAITIDHDLRENSADEAARVAQWCADMGVAHHVKVWRDWDHTGNLQDAARQARYRIINEWRGDIQHILIGHTLDDQAETLLLRLKRGSGVDGMTGMKPVAHHPSGMMLIRPLLDILRQDLRDYLGEIDQPWCDDPSNENTAFDRIAMRQLLPQLQSAGISLDRFALMAKHMQRAQAALDQTARDVFQKTALQQGTDLILDHNGFLRHRTKYKRACYPQACVGFLVIFIDRGLMRCSVFCQICKSQNPAVCMDVWFIRIKILFALRVNMRPRSPAQITMFGMIAGTLKMFQPILICGH